MASTPFVAPSDVKRLQSDVQRLFELARADLRTRATAGTFEPGMPSWDAWQALKPRVSAFLSVRPTWKTGSSAIDTGNTLLVDIGRFSSVSGARLHGAIFTTWQDMETLKEQVQADYRVLKTAVEKCNAEQPAGARGPGQLDDQTLSDWDVMAGRVEVFLKQDSSVISLDTQVEAGKALQTDLAKWHARLKAAGCTVSDAPTMPDSGFSFGALGTALTSLITSPIGLLLVFLILREAKK